jgi:[acyl-carrier-protein] S-malonyltransferase
MVSQGIETAIECGPGKVLSGMNKRIHRGMAVVSLEAPESFDKALEMTQASQAAAE